MNESEARQIRIDAVARAEMIYQELVDLAWKIYFESIENERIANHTAKRDLLRKDYVEAVR